MFTGLLSKSNWVSRVGFMEYLNQTPSGVSHMGIHDRGDFIFVACEYTGLRVYTMDENGVYTLKDTNNHGGARYWEVWADSNLVYAATSLGLKTYEVSGAGILTYKDTDYIGSPGFYFDVWGDGTLIYCAAGQKGIISHSVSGSGVISRLDSDYLGDDTYSDEYVAVEGDGTYLFVACEEDGIRTYSVNGSGIFTFESVIWNLSQAGQGVNDLCYHNGAVYAACERSGMYSYTVGGGGVLTPVRVDPYDPTKIFRYITTDGVCVYAAYESAIGSYEIKGGGVAPFKYANNFNNSDSNQVGVSNPIGYLHVGQDLATSPGRLKSGTTELVG